MQRLRFSTLNALFIFVASASSVFADEWVFVTEGQTGSRMYVSNVRRKGDEVYLRRLTDYETNSDISKMVFDCVRDTYRMTDFYVYSGRMGVGKHSKIHLNPIDYSVPPSSPLDKILNHVCK